MVKGRGNSKIILFGEHFVVYVLPGIASGIDRYVEVEAEKISGNDIIINDVDFYKEEVNLTQNPEHVKSKYYLDVLTDLGAKGVKFTWRGTSVPGAGMGFSAAVGVAMLRALNKLLDWGLDDEGINEKAYELEKIAHGTPSGIDNTCATYNSLIWFEKNMEGGKNTINLLSLGQPLYLVIGDTGKKGNTKELVAGVKERKEANEKKYAEIFKEAKELVIKAKDALTNGEVEEVGTLMIQNQLLLEQIGVSSPELEELVKIALDNNALGAKLVGAGGGGLMVALVKDQKEQELISQKFEEAGYKSIKTVVEK